jgi:hypothetical protein
MPERMRLFACLMILGFPLQAQHLEEGPGWKGNSGHRPILIAGQTSGGIWLVSGSSDKNDGIIRDLMLEKIDTQGLVLKASFEFPGLFADRQQFYPEGVFVWNDTIRIFGSAYDKTQKRHQLLMRNLYDSGVLTPPKEMFSYPAAGYIYNKRRFNIEKSAEQNCFVVWGFTQSTDSLSIEYAVFDKNLGIIKRNNLSQKSPGDVESEQALVDGYGNVHFLLSDPLKSLQHGRSYTLFAFPVMSDEVVAYHIELPDKRIHSISIQITNDDYLIAAGYYADLFRGEEDVSGYFFLKINRETGEIPVKEIRQMGQEFLNLYSGQGNNPSRKDFERLKLRKIFAVLSGGSMLLSEQEWTENRCETDVRTGQRVCDTHYFYGSVILQHFNASGSVDWVQILRKYQQTIGDEGNYSSFLLQAHNKALSLYYNAPSESGKGGKPSLLEPEKSVLGYYRLDASGQDDKGISRVSGGFQALPATGAVLNGSLYFLGEKDGYRKLYRSESQP